MNYRSSNLDRPFYAGRGSVMAPNRVSHGERAVDLVIAREERERRIAQSLIETTGLDVAQEVVSAQDGQLATSEQFEIAG